jgi:hypothetical protein
MLLRFGLDDGERSKLRISHNLEVISANFPIIERLQEFFKKLLLGKLKTIRSYILCCKGLNTADNLFLVRYRHSGTDIAPHDIQKFDSNRISGTRNGAGIISYMGGYKHRRRFSYNCTL